MPKKPIRILIAEDEFIIINALYRALPDQDLIPYQIDIVALTKTGSDILKLAEKHRPDIAILDQVLTEVCGAEAAKMLAKAKRPPYVIMYSGYPSRLSLEECQEANIRGFVDKCRISELIRAIGIVYTGGTYFNGEILNALYGQSLASAQPLLPWQESLTAREAEVLKLLQRGLSQSGIAEKLNLSPATIKTHLKHLREKAQCTSLRELKALLAQSSLPTAKRP
ncbi:MAG: response regulator transcription factor [Candidatus Sericytochromatia bacterium]